jgi:serine/threonine-protein kinase RsbW
MAICKKEHILYGLDHYLQVINDIINELEARTCEFDIKMILTEAIANAFYHGNKSDDKLPIYVRYHLVSRKVTFEIEDCGVGIEDLNVIGYLDAEDLLSDGNRGLFLIGCYSDKLDYQNKILRVEKILQ